jgi:hypothetical protein
MSGREQFKAALKEKFPAEAAAIDRYVALLDSTRPTILGFVQCVANPYFNQRRFSFFLTALVGSRACRSGLPRSW